MTSITISGVIGIPCGWRLVLERIAGIQILVWLKLQFSKGILTKSCSVLSDAEDNILVQLSRDDAGIIGGDKLDIGKFA